MTCPYSKNHPLLSVCRERRRNVIEAHRGRVNSVWESCGSCGRVLPLAPKMPQATIEPPVAAVPVPESEKSVATPKREKSLARRKPHRRLINKAGFSRCPNCGFKNRCRCRGGYCTPCHNAGDDKKKLREIKRLRRAGLIKMGHKEGEPCRHRRKA